MNEKEQWIKDTNEWALKVGDAIFNKEYYKLRLALTDDTWKLIVSNLNITDPADKRFKMIPTKFLEQAMQGSVRKAINEDGVKLAGLAAAVPGAIIGGGALAKPVLSLMFYHPGTFLAETVGSTIGGYAGGAATDAITRLVSDYDSFANMIASNSTIPELYAEMLNPGMLLGGLAGGAGGNVLYNNIVKPTAQRTALPYLAAMQLNKNIRNANLGTTVFDDAVLQGKVGWGPSQEIKWRHGSDKPIERFIPFDRWDVKNHGASPYEYFTTEMSSPPNMMDERAIQYFGRSELQKPIVLTGEFNIIGPDGKLIKNATRNQLVSEARNRGADSYYLKDIRDNAADHQNVLIKFIDGDGEDVVLNSHLQGDGAVRMFKDYLLEIGDVKLPESINVDLLKRYIPEARERYGLVGNDNITDDEILKALYHHTNELGKGTAAVNVDGEPLLLFRGSTSRHDKLIPKGTSELFVSGADNILGNLFLGELPGTVQGSDRGIARYLGLNHGWLGPIPPQTRAAEVILPESKILDKDMYTLYTSKKFGDVKKLPGYALNTGYNDINAFIVRTPNVRDATEEIVVINPFNTIPEHKRLGTNHSLHYRALIKDAESKNQGLIHSKPVMEIGPSGENIGKFRDEHEYYNYFALPNFNIKNAKHILPYDLRIPRNWEDPIIYRKQGGTINYLNLFK